MRISSARKIAITGDFLPGINGNTIAHQLGAIPGSLFAQHVFAVVGYGVFTDEKAHGNLLGAEAFGYAREDLCFAPGKFWSERFGQCIH
jgi:hypothetical protein